MQIINLRWRKKEVGIKSTKTNCLNINFFHQAAALPGRTGVTTDQKLNASQSFNAVECKAYLF